MNMLSKIRNFRLQPIIRLSYGSPNIIAYEMLVNLHNHEVDLEFFFKTLPLIEFKKLFVFQSALCSSLNGSFYVNTPLDLLLEHYISGVIYDSNYNRIQPDKLCIEIQNPCRLLQLSDLDLAELKTEISLLQASGAQVWLDDISETYSSLAIALGVDGVKLDKTFFWSIDNLFGLQERFNQQNISVIVEGVESIEHYNKVAKSDCILVQGFLWPDIQIDFNGRVSQ
ncbi:EAL domain-containing protein [Vibrio diabolicus]|nr:EAL domain-containing protein [Vibrio diabolicus]